jgi:hypothetical protein
MALDDLDEDGDGELIFNGSGRDLLRVWDLPYKFDPAKADWIMFQHDPQHIGNYNYHR